MHPHPKTTGIDPATLEWMMEVMDPMMTITGIAQIIFMLGLFILLVTITSWFKKVLKEAHAALIHWNESMSPDYSSRKHKLSKRARHVESDQRVTGYPQKTAETRPG